MSPKPRKNDLIFLMLLVFLPAIANGFDYINGTADNPYIPGGGIYAPSETAVYIPLSGKWTLKKGNDVAEVIVPGCWKAGQGCAILEKSFEIDDTLTAKHFRLIFWGARQSLTIRLNDRLLEAWESDWTVLIVDIPKDVLKIKETNLLEIEVNDALSSRASIPLNPKLSDEQPYAGLFSDVALFVCLETIVDQLYWKSKLDDSYSSSHWEISLVFRNMGKTQFDSTKTKSLSIQTSWECQDSSHSGQAEEISIELGPVEESVAVIKGEISNPKLWSPDNPTLYNFNLVVNEGKDSRKLSFQTGFCKYEWKQTGLSINGEETWLQGIDYFQENEEHAIAMSTKDVEEDLIQIKRLGFNLVRFYYPLHPATLEICDRLGLLAIPHTGLKSVPGQIFNDAPMSTRLTNTITELVKHNIAHISVTAWGLVDGIPCENTCMQTISNIADNLSTLDNRPLIIGVQDKDLPDLPDGVVGIRLRPPYRLFEPIVPLGEINGPWLIGGLGGFASLRSKDEDVKESQVRQADALLHQLNQVRNISSTGFVISCYADYRSAWPMIITGSEVNQAVVSRGLLTLDRDERIAFRKVADALSQARIEVPAIRVEERDFPVVFPISALAVIALLLLARRQNNVFRQNLNRVFAHTAGFLHDIRDRRYFQMSQTLLIAIIVSTSQSILLAGWLHHVRYNYLFDYLITLLIPVWKIKNFVISWSWNPVYAIAGITLFHLSLIFFVAIILRLLSIPFKGNLNLKQSINMIVWGASHFILLVPLGLVHYKLLEYAWYGYSILFLSILFSIWYLFRILSMIRIGYRIRIVTAWSLLIVLTLVIFGALISIFQSSYSIVENFHLYLNVIVPWINA